MSLNRDDVAHFDLLQAIEEGVVVAGQQDGAAFAGNPHANIILEGADALV